MAERIEVGDKVRLSVEGVAETPIFGSSEYVSIGGRSFYLDRYKVEIIEKVKPKLKVGDKISDQLYKALPAGAVVVAGSDRFAIADGKGNLVTTGGQVLDGAWHPRELVFLP